MSKNILEVCFSPSLGGLELHVKKVSKHLEAFSVIAKDSKLEKLYRDSNLKYMALKKFDFLKLAKIIDKNEIKIVHIHWTKDILVAVLAKIFSKQKPKIVQTRHMHMTRFKSDFYHKFLYKNIDIMIAVTKLVAKQLKTYIPKEVIPKIEVCYIGTDTPKKLLKHKKEELKARFGLKDEFLVCIVGRIEEAKGQHIVLDAVKKLQQKEVNVKALVVGDYMDKEYFKKLGASYEDAIFTGFVKNTSEIMQLSDCVVLATKKETFGLVLIEAMKCGICVLGSNKGGPLEIIEDGKSGLLFESMDSKDLSQKLVKIAKDNEYKNKLAKNGKHRANELFDSQKQFLQMEAILEIA